MEFLEIPLFDDDLFKMLIRFGINMLFLVVIIRFLYYTSSRRQDFLFTYFMIGIIVFFLCFTLKKFELDLGMALGLFAIFGIIRYRTDTIEIKEMTYLFVVIGVSVINSLANKKMSYSELILANAIIVVSIIVIERLWLSKKVESKKIVYDNIEDTKPENLKVLKAKLEEKTGLAIQKIVVNDINILVNTVKITIYYKSN
ncbi:DUF4956 domain-containing protein [Snuella sedimenti]|uniref:DUF4956 domain-containing protein n=1 Tax=Snuella sedimenti TaxID=2798802 RepID=A0A8J7J1T9_9FLAO|nr:DUF4956 domain-containing protein [Snuella sedimenti]MBJ6367484.1 DUF4956 domain-containing protein [Snuella sedimenti]